LDGIVYKEVAMSRSPISCLVIIACLIPLTVYVTSAQEVQLPSPQHIQVNSDVPTPSPYGEQQQQYQAPAAPPAIAPQPPSAPTAPSAPPATAATAPDGTPPAFSPVPPAAPLPTAPAQPPIATRPVSQETYVAELLGIVTDTESIDAYLVTTTLLARAKGNGRAAVPLLIRNAERLGIFDRYALEEGTRGAGLANHVAKLIEQQAAESASVAATSPPMPPIQPYINPGVVQTQLQQVVPMPENVVEGPAQTQRPGTTTRPPSCLPQPRPRPIGNATTPRTPLDKVVD
jgi:hypothetical protein